MPRRTIGEELQHLFAERDRGRLPEHEFQRRKVHLLQISACRLPAMMPNAARTAATTAAVASAAAFIALLVVGAVGH
jgi:hypothetical protein